MASEMSGHLNMVLLETMAGLKLQAIHYKVRRRC